jgi:hypothetical protein
MWYSCQQRTARRPAILVPDVEQVALIDHANHAAGIWSLRRDSHLRPGVILRLTVWPRCVVDGHERAVALRQQRAERARTSERLVAGHGHDLTGVRVVGSNDDERVGVTARELQADADGAVERDGLADLLAGVLDVILLVDRRALDLKEEAAPSSPIAAGRVPLPRAVGRIVVEEIEGLLRHGRQ